MKSWGNHLLQNVLEAPPLATQKVLIPPTLRVSYAREYWPSPAPQQVYRTLLPPSLVLLLIKKLHLFSRKVSAFL